MKLSFKSLALLGAGLFLTTAHSQDENYFANYKKLGFSLEYGIGFSDNELNAGVGFELKNLRIPSVGLSYNVYQHKNWNFNINSNFRLYNHAILYSLQEDAVGPGLPSYIIEKTLVEHSFLDINTRLMAEYIKPINQKYSFKAAFGLSTLYYPKDESIISGSATISGTEFLSEDYRTGNRSLYFGTVFSAGLDIKTRDFLYRWSLNYQHNLSGALDVYDIRTFNLENHPDTHAQKKFTGHNLSLGLTVHPSHYLFKKKNPEEKVENKNTFVRNIFKEYSPLALSLGFDYFWESKYLSNPFYSNPNVKIDAFSYAKSVGLHYNYFNPGRFSFRAGLNFRQFTKDFSVFLSKEATGFDEDVTIKGNRFDINHLGFSQMFDYYIPINEKTNLITTLGATIEKMFPSTEEQRLYPQSNGSSSVLIQSYTYFEEDPLVHARLGLGLEKKTNSFMYRIELNYQLKLTYENSETYLGVQNIQNLEVTRSYHMFSFSNVGVSLLLRPHKKLFGKK